MKFSLICLATLLAGPLASHGATIYQNAVLADNPTLYWSFDEAGDTDNAHSLVNDVAANELVARGAAGRAPSTTTNGGVSLGRAASFDANADLQSRFNSANLSPVGSLGSFAVELWFNVDNSPQRYFSEAFSDGGSSNQPGVIWNFNAGQFELFGGGRTGTLVAPDSWHHIVAASYGGGNGVEIYVDGVSAATITNNYSNPQAFGEFAIGNTARNPQAVNGLIDEYAIYDLGGFANLGDQQAHVAGIASHYNLVPEPSAALLIGLSTLALVLRRRRT